MKAVGYTETGPIDRPNALIDFEAETPTPKGHDLLVKVEAVSVNPVDTKIRRRRAPAEGAPDILGWDAAGEVVSIGDAVSRFSVGDKVYYAGAVNRPGTNSELHLVDERIVGKAPGSIPASAAAAMPLTTLTAYEMLFDGLRVGVAGHPEGMPVLSERECDYFLNLKNQYARDTGTEMFVMTQWSLDVATIHRWLDRIETFNTLPIYLGIAGPTSPATLLKFAHICGVKTSLLGLRHQSGRLGKLLTVQTPDYLVDGLGDRIQHFHIYTFGGIQRSGDWLITRQSDVGIPA